MTTETGEPERTMRLLWRSRIDTEQPRRGPKPKASIDEIIDAAIALADADGLEAVTMRSVAERVGVGAMTLYGYVPGRPEMLGLMVDQVASEGERLPHTGDVSARVTRIADELMGEYQRHPWLVDVRLPRPWIGPHMSDRYEWQLAALEPYGLDDIVADQLVTMIDAYVRGAASSWIDQQARLAMHESDNEWWVSIAWLLDEVMDADAYPISGRVGAAAGELYGLGDSDYAYRFGLERLIVAVQSLVSAD